MLIVKSTSHGEKKVRILVTDTDPGGENISGVVPKEIGEYIVKSITTPGSDFTTNQVRALMGISKKNEVNELIRRSREKYGVTINQEDGSVTLPSGAVLPDAFRRMITSVTDEKDIQAVLAFGEKLVANPLAHARDSLIEWITRNPSLAITRDGDVIGYRGLREDYTSIHSGYGIVNGVHYTDAHLDNSPGNVIEFPREMIDHNPDNFCSVGLHVGTWDFASSFTRGPIVIVTFSPADVVSPPRDAEQEKIRVSSMTVRASISNALPADEQVHDDFN